MTTPQLKKAAMCLLITVVCGFTCLFAGDMIYRTLTFLVVSEPVLGTVQSSTVESVPAAYGGPDYKPVISYQYRYQGRSFTSRNLKPGPMDAYEAEHRAREVAGRYAPGETVTVHVHPDTPSEAFLMRSGPSLWVWAFGLITLALALGGAKGLSDALRGVDP